MTSPYTFLYAEWWIDLCYKIMFLLEESRCNCTLQGGSVRLRRESCRRRIEITLNSAGFSCANLLSHFQLKQKTVATDPVTGISMRSSARDSLTVAATMTPNSHAFADLFTRRKRFSFTARARRDETRLSRAGLIGSRDRKRVNVGVFHFISQTGRRYYHFNRNFAAPVETLGWARASISNGKRKSRRASSEPGLLLFLFFVCASHNALVCEWRWDNAGRPRMRDLITGIIRRDSRNCVTSCS